MSVVDFSELFLKLEDYKSRIEKLEKAFCKSSLLSLDEFIVKGYMSHASFYQKAPRGLVAGAVKIHGRWFVDEKRFLNEAMMSDKK